MNCQSWFRIHTYSKPNPQYRVMLPLLSPLVSKAGKYKFLHMLFYIYISSPPPPLLSQFWPATCFYNLSLLFLPTPSSPPSPSIITITTIMHTYSQALFPSNKERSLKACFICISASRSGYLGLRYLRLRVRIWRQGSFDGTRK